MLVLFALLLVVVGALSAREPLQLRRDGVSAAGTVVALVARPMSDKGGSVQHAVVRFPASSGGDAIQFEDRMGASPPMYRVGESVRVLYLADSPARSAIVDRGVWNLLPALLLATGGLLLLAMGLSMWLQRPLAGEAAVTGASAAAVARVGRAAEAASQVPQAGSAPRHPRLWAVALSVVALVLVFAPPSDKTGNAALGVVLCVMAGVVAAFRVAVTLVAGVAFAGLRTAVAARSGMARGLGPDDPATAWEAAADESPRLRTASLHYEHFRRALWVIGMILLVIGVALMGIEFLKHAIDSPH